MIKFSHKNNTVREMVENLIKNEHPIFYRDIVRDVYKEYDLDHYDSRDREIMYDKSYEEIKSLAEKIISIRKFQEN